MFNRVLRPLMLASLICSNVHASYKKPDLRQQRQQARRIEQLERRHSFKPAASFEYDCSSLGQTAIIAMLAILLVAAPAAAAAMAATPTSDSSSIIRFEPYTPGQELQTFGPCNRQLDGSIICCNIRPHYTVDCCRHSNTTTNSRCGSFDLGGIIGGKRLDMVAHYNLYENIFAKTQIFCTQRPDTQIITAESYTFVTQLSKKLEAANYDPQQLQVDFPYYDDFEMLRDDGQPCYITLWDITQTNLIPHLSAIIKDLALRYNLLNMPRIFIYDSSPRGSSYSSPASIIGFTLTDPYGSKTKIEGIGIPYQVLLTYSDKQLTEVLAHEVFHLKQNEHSGFVKGETNIDTGNNKEAEADIAGTLATGSPCATFALCLRAGFSRDSADTYITRENADRLLAGQSHPSATKRLSVSMLTLEQYTRLKELLSSTGV